MGELDVGDLIDDLADLRAVVGDLQKQIEQLDSAGDRVRRFQVSFGLCADLRSRGAALPRIELSILGQRGLGHSSYPM